MKSTSMKASIPNWLDNPSLSHVQASFLCQTNGDVSLQCADPEASNEGFSRAMMTIANIVAPLIEQGVLPGEMIWSFQTGKIYYAVRKDGAALGLFCKAGSDTETAAVREFIADFIKQR